MRCIRCGREFREGEKPGAVIEDFSEPLWWCVGCAGAHSREDLVKEIVRLLRDDPERPDVYL